MTYEGQNVLVLGLGRSGVAAVRLLRRHGARVSAYDRDPARLGEIEPEVERLSGPTPPNFDAFDRVVTSPGFPAAPHPKLQPEIDVAAPHLKAPLIGITGTNGKSTTAVLIGEMLRRSGLAVPIGGNLGDPLCELVDTPADLLVAELSSFQLEHARVLHVQTGVLLNLAADHLDRHGTLEAYGAAKAKLATLQRQTDTLIVNLDDPWARRVGEGAIARTLGFSASPLDHGAFLDGRDLVLIYDGKELVRLAQEKLSTACRAPVTNALASMLAASVAGATPEAIRAVLESFEGLPHRARLVSLRQRVRYVDDSKATNPTAAATSLASQPQGTIWIAGGRNKGLDFEPLAVAAGGMRAAILFGEARRELAATLEDVIEIVEVESLEEAVKAAAERALPGGTVLLAPACSSFDQFSSFEERGRRFAELVRALPERDPC
jgi:UDP-N-acetylmuramoylalanine--D-glutamate ligase